MRRERSSSTPVVSRDGRRATRVVGFLRLGYAVCAGGALVGIGYVIDNAGAAALAVSIAFVVAAGILAFAEISFGGRAARSEERRIRADLLRREFGSVGREGGQDGEFGELGELGPARVIQLMTDNTERVTEYRQVYFGATLAAMLVPFVVLAYIGLAIDPVVGFTVMVLCPFIPLLIRGFMVLFRRTSADSRRQRGLLAGRYLDAIRNLTTIRLLGAGPRIEAELRDQGEANRGAIMRLLAGNQIVIIVMDGLFALILICATAALTIWRSDHLSAGMAVSIMLLTVLLLEPLQQVAGFFYIGMGGMASQKAIRAYRAATSTGLPGPGSQPADAAPVAADDVPELAVDLRGVRYDYGRGEVLRGIDLAVPIGVRVAIVGPSGAGKSTLLGLIRGVLAPQAGRVAIGGRVVDPLDLGSARAHCATVAQATWMFTGTVADNLRVARPDATESQMWHALELAHVADEVAAMPHGLDTALGEGTGLVSGGQAQRLSLARALVSGRRLLLLDEPTSNVDIESESRIIDAVAGLPRGWTVVMVTHRPALLALADDVFELTDGRLARQGVRT